MKIASKTIPHEGGGQLRFRPAESHDYPLLLNLYASTRAEEMALTNWDQTQKEAFIKMQFDAQQSHYQAYHPKAEHLLILLDDMPVGRLYLEDRPEEIHILDITVSPERRGAGLGTRVVKELMAESSASGKSLTIYVESYNRSLGLFQRLGFQKAGELGYSHLMKFSH
jgi:ribosomal protein S18 acetylase RimI-like enzyme